MSQDYCNTKKAKYKRLDKESRIKIECFLLDGVNMSEIAWRLGVHRSTVCREIKRGSVRQKREIIEKPCYENYFTAKIITEYYMVYFADSAQSRAVELLEDRFKRSQVIFEKGYVDFIDSQIIGSKKTVSVYTANLKAKEYGFKTVSDRTLYNWIHKGLLKTRPIDLLLTVQREIKKPPKPKINKRILGESIEKRPESVNSRVEFGHFEGDSIVGANHQGQIITLVERMTRIGFMFKFDKMDAMNMVHVKELLQKQFGERFNMIFKSITFDNGSEFSHNIEDENLRIYFAHPYSSFERGSNENFNGIVRRYIKKGTDFTNITNSDILRINNAINNMPRKLFGGKTALQMFQAQLVEHKLTA